MKTTLYFIAFFTLILMAAMTLETSGATLYKAGVEVACRDICR